MVWYDGNETVMSGKHLYSSAGLRYQSMANGGIQIDKNQSGWL